MTRRRRGLYIRQPTVVFEGGSLPPRSKETRWAQELRGSAPTRRPDAWSNDELAEFLDTSDEWIRSHTGIGYRHIAGDDEAASDLGAEAAKVALARSGTDPESIDMVLVATASSDYVGFPSTACIVQDMIGARNAAAMDIGVGCTGFVYGLETAKGFIASGAAERVLLIGSEVLTRIVDWTDRSTCVLFGDGAGAAVISPSGQRPRDPRLGAQGGRLGRPPTWRARSAARARRSSRAATRSATS